MGTKKGRSSSAREASRRSRPSTPGTWTRCCTTSVTGGPTRSTGWTASSSTPRWPTSRTDTSTRSRVTSSRRRTTTSSWTSCVTVGSTSSPTPPDCSSSGLAPAGSCRSSSWRRVRSPGLPVRIEEGLEGLSVLSEHRPVLGPRRTLSPVSLSCHRHPDRGKEGDSECRGSRSRTPPLVQSSRVINLLVPEEGPPVETGSPTRRWSPGPWE